MQHKHRWHESKVCCFKVLMARFTPASLIVTGTIPRPSLFFFFFFSQEGIHSQRSSFSACSVSTSDFGLSTELATNPIRISENVSSAVFVRQSGQWSACVDSAFRTRPATPIG